MSESIQSLKKRHSVCDKKLVTEFRHITSKSIWMVNDQQTIPKLEHAENNKNFYKRKNEQIAIWKIQKIIKPILMQRMKLKESSEKILSAVIKIQRALRQWLTLKKPHTEPKIGWTSPKTRSRPLNDLEVLNIVNP